ncbi:MAG TPA: type IV pili methyl-accepting chemotaxis transducer N-terminal domain-containing protein [Burkholderiaceae bacterium]|jgi:AmiR/NasT family two-component response regulator
MSQALESPQRVLFLAEPEALLPALRCTALARTTRLSLVQDALKQRPEVLVLWHPPAADIEDWLHALKTLPAPLPVVVIAAGVSAAQQRLGFDVGVQVWLERAEELHNALPWALWQFERQQTLQAQLDDRHWTERAKGLLMHACHLEEDSAHRLLRDTAMHARLRLGELSRSVVQAAQLAEGMNLAGQQRMLSQRIVKLIAQRAAAIEPKRAKVLQDESAARVDGNLTRLAQLLPTMDLQPVNQAWDALKPLLIGKPTAEVLAEADVCAQTLLERSEALTQAIEQAGAGKPLGVVNLCGRQRMLSQRLAKSALLADMLPAFEPTDITANLDAFSAGLTELESAPLSSAAIRELLARVHEEWLRLLRSLRVTQGSEAAAGLARSSEVLLNHLDQLTTEYQQSLQLILG